MSDMTPLQGGNAYVPSAPSIDDTHPLPAAAPPRKNGPTPETLAGYVTELVTDLQRFRYHSFSNHVATSARGVVGIDLLKIFQGPDVKDVMDVADWHKVQDVKGRFVIDLKLPKGHPMTAKVQLALAEKLDYTSQTEGDVVHLKCPVDYKVSAL